MQVDPIHLIDFDEREKPRLHLGSIVPSDRSPIFCPVYFVLVHRSYCLLFIALPGAFFTLIAQRLIVLFLPQVVAVWQPM
jgi:hypothetical protein